MRPLYRGIAVAVVQCLLVLSVAGKYALDRERLPRAWARALRFDPNLPIRGRYVSLSLEVDGMVGAPVYWASVTLSVRNGRLVAEPVPFDTGVRVIRWSNGPWRIAEPVAFFISEHVPDPSRRPPGEEVWVEVSVPRRGEPRPIRLAVKKDGVLTPLNLR
ncbi:MAG: hypothetical protein ABSH37_01905 [Bryobacteraceae bacterium]|jgi:hypothetical protein